MQRHELLDDTVDILRRHGATEIRHRRGRHIKVVALYRGQSITVTISVSPSDWRAAYRNRSAIKRVLRAAEQRGLAPHA